MSKSHICRKRSKSGKMEVDAIGRKWVILPGTDVVKRIKDLCKAYSWTYYLLHAERHDQQRHGPLHFDPGEALRRLRNLAVAIFCGGRGCRRSDRSPEAASAKLGGTQRRRQSLHRKVHLLPEGTSETRTPKQNRRAAEGTPIRSAAIYLLQKRPKARVTPSPPQSSRP